VKRRLLLALPLLLLAAPAVRADDMAGAYRGAMPDTGGIDPMNDPRVVKITSRLACDCGTCPHRPANECECSTAQRIRALTANKISKGMTGDDAIIASLVDELGETILPRPPFSGFNLVAYLGPFVAIGTIGLLLWRAIGRWQDKASPEPAAKPKTPATDDPYLAQVDAELKGRS
jgi:cytochrome c-type biogenesis protein CcmH